MIVCMLPRRCARGRAPTPISKRWRASGASAALGPVSRAPAQTPRLLLSTIPFLALLALLGVLSVAIMIIAYPGNQPQPKPTQTAQHEQGVAGKGWFEAAQKEMHD